LSASSHQQIVLRPRSASIADFAQHVRPAEPAEGQGGEASAGGATTHVALGLAVQDRLLGFQARK